MTLSPIFFDALCLLLVVGCCFYYGHKGFIAGVFGMLGSLVAFGASVFLARLVSGGIFSRFIRPGLVERLGEAVAEQLAEYGSLTAEMLLEGASGFLPETALEAVAARLGDTSGLPADAIAATLVDEVLAPLLVPVIALVVFLFFFAILRLIFTLLLSVLRRVGRLPIIGTANRALGAIIGALVGLLYCFVLVAAVAAAQNFGGTHPVLADIQAGSFAYALLAGDRIFSENGWFYNFFSTLNL